MSVPYRRRGKGRSCLVACSLEFMKTKINKIEVINNLIPVNKQSLAENNTIK